MSDRQPVLVIGGARGTGLLIARLLHRRVYNVRVLARDPRRVRTLFDSTVDVIGGDLTKSETLGPAVDGVRHIIFTAGCRSGYPVGESRIRATEYEGILNTLAAMRQVGFTGRFMYMTSSGLMTSSLSTWCLNLWKGNTLVWRLRAEAEIRASGVNYTVIRTGVLLNGQPGIHPIAITQEPLPLSLRYRIARADVAEVFLAALEHVNASRATFEAVWGPSGSPEGWARQLDRIQPYVKDYDAVGDPPSIWPSRFDTSRWALFLARDDGRSLGR